MRPQHAVFLALLLAAPWAHAEGPTIRTEDDVALTAEHWGKGTHGVLLVHADGRSASDWSALGPRLAANGLHALAIDLRGHGASAAGEPDYAKMKADLSAGVAWLRTQGATRVHVVGAGLGANLALATAADDTGIDDVVLLSPQLNAQGYKASAAIAAYGSRPLLVVASKADTLSAKTAGYLAKQARGPHHLELYDDAGVGARMLNGAPALEPLILSWLHGTFLQASDPSSAAHAVKSGGFEAIEAQGTLLQDRQR